MAIQNRYDFVMLFDVETGIQTGIRMQEMLPGWMRRPDMVLLRMYV